MPLDPNIYQQMQPNLASQLAGSVNQFTEQRARLSDLAQQREFQQSQMARNNQLQDFQIRDLQRKEAEYPEQQRLVAQSRSEKANQDLALGFYGGLSSGKPVDEINVWHAQTAPKLGASPEVSADYQRVLNSNMTNEEKLDFFRMQASGRKGFEQEQEAMLKQKYAKPETSSNLGRLQSERARLAAANPNDPNIKIYDQAIQKETTHTPFMQVATGEDNAQLLITAPKLGGAPTVTQLGITKPTKEVQLSPQAQKELFEADENAQAATGVINTLNQAMLLNNQAYSGFGALLKAKAESNLPGQVDPKADATIQLDNLIREQALSSLKLTFGGSPTEGERAMLLELQASAEKTPKQRKAIINKAIEMADKKLRFNQQKAESLRGGTYFKEAPKATQQTAQPEIPANAVTLPDGRVKQFSSAAAAQAFKKAAGLQ